MALDIGALVAPLSDEEPSGPDLYGDYDRQAIEGAFERSVSDDGAGAAEADWADTIDKIVRQAGQTRDLWLPVYLMRAAAQAGQFDLVVDGAELLARLIEERWDDVHPQLDEVGFIGRKNPCESLTRLGDFLGPLQRATIVSHARLGSFSGADFIRFNDEGSAAENFGLFRALVEATPIEDLEAIVARIAALGTALRRADSALTSHAGDDTSINFQPAYDTIERLRKAVSAQLPTGADEAQPDDFAIQADGGGQPAPVSGKSFAGAINSRADVVRAIDQICAYYERNEPGSPVPFVLRRAKDWISLDFMAMLEDIAPGSLDEATKVLKSQRSDASGDSDNNGW
jgi:type VI secretion system protein ImpA